MPINHTKIAIVGMAFRFPGDLSTEDAFWQVLKQGRDVVSQIGEDRWATDVLSHPKRSEPGRSISFAAGVLSRLDAFDASFFGISPREAGRLDPQQRLLLELAWEAMENGGIAPSRLAGSDCAVYVGISGLDYGMRALDDMSSMDAYSMTGNTLSIAANRLSYVFNLHGPSMAVDTACSSSLVALHQACRSLRDGESSVALVGGVNLLLHPYPFVGFTKASMLSAGGRCKPFDASGDGYVRSEGGAVLLLKPLAQAEADGDDIQAVILASGSNSDGGRKSGITIPSVDGQSELLRLVMRQAGITAADLDYVEAHGTGTAVGDPIETAAIGQVIGQAREAGKPLLVGSVKSNLGHLEPASGMAGLIKTVLALKHRSLPPSIHVDTLNPNIDFSGLNLEVVTAYRELPASAKPLCMGVNSFGFGGANAHVVLQEHRGNTIKRRAKKPSTAPALILSARAPEALLELARQYGERLSAANPPDSHDFAYAAAYRRQWLENRLAVFGRDAKQITERLAAYARGEAKQGVVEETALVDAGKTAFVYTGNGAQWLGMGRALLDESPAFAKLLSELDDLIRQHNGISILAELRAEPDQSRLELTEVAQPALFALQVAVTSLLRAQGLDAAAACGHSVGEVAAAWAVGALSLKQAVRVICERSGAQSVAKGSGRMAAVGLSEEAAELAVQEAGLADSIVVAAINSPDAVTLSGSFVALERLNARLNAPPSAQPSAQPNTQPGTQSSHQKVFYRLLELDYAFHSPAMDPIQASVLSRLDDLAPQTGNRIFVSSVTGGVLSGKQLNAHYWWRNIREPVRFKQAIDALASVGCRVFVEIGPHALLQRYIKDALSQLGIAGRVLATLKKGDDGHDRLLETAWRACLLGAPFKLEKHFSKPASIVRLPTYPWQRERHWHTQTSAGYDLISRKRVHPLLGYRLKDGDASWENPLDPLVLPYLADHQVGGAVVLPGAAYVEMALAASREWFGHDRHEMEEMDIVAPVVFDGEHARVLRFDLTPADGGFQIRSRPRLSQDAWTLNAVGRLIGEPLAKPPANQFPIENTQPDAIELDTKAHYALASQIGLNYGPAFQGLQHVWVNNNELLARLQLPTEIETGLAQHILHPALLDVCFQSLLDIFHADISAGQGVTLLPVRVGRLRYYGGEPTWFRTRLNKLSPRSVLAEFQLLDAAGETVAQLTGCRFRAVTLNQQGTSLPALWRHAYRLQPHPNDEQPNFIEMTRELVHLARTTLASQEPKLHRREYFLGVVPLFDALVGAFAFEAYQRLAADNPDVLQAMLSDASGVPEDVRPLFAWLTRLLEEDGLLRQNKDHWQLIDANPPPPAEAIWRAILGDFPNALPDLVFVGRVGRHLVELLTGTLDAGVFQASLAKSHLLEQHLDASPTYLGINQAAREIIQSITSNWPQDRRLRILEISGGSEDFPRQLLADLPLDRCDYVIAETEGDQLASLESEYANHAVIRVATLDLANGFNLTGNTPLPAQFDVVLLHHWLHRAAEIPPILAALKRRLACGGLLIMLERHPDRAADLQHGLDAGWWHQADGQERLSSLLTPASWSAFLEQQGFGEIEVLREPAADGIDTGAYALLAKNPDATPQTAQEATQTWLLLADSNGAGSVLTNRLAANLRSHGQQVVMATAATDTATNTATLHFDPASAASCRDLLAEVQRQFGRCDHLVHCLGLSDAPTSSASSLMDLQVLRCESTLHLLHAIESSSAAPPPRLWLITAGGSTFSTASDTCLHQPGQAPLWGLGRVIMNEHPELACVLIDLQPDSLDNEATAWLSRELLSPDTESEIILTSQGRFLPRMQPAALPALPSPEESETGYRLDFNVPGQLRNLHWRPQAQRALAVDEIEIRPVAVGLNFRDVMYAMGLLSDEAVENGFSGASLGLELAGRVSRVGARVEEFKVGDEVVAFAPACLSSHVITRAGSVAEKPAAWSFEQAATVPTVFFTVYYALKHLANLQPGERVLIHGAAGGVGIAAIQVARYLGAEIFATAGNAEKRDFVHLMGADHVMSSRSLAFADDILALTNGEGVDVVLNSLAGEAINRNFRVLRPFGRFLELGKRDFYENTHIGLRPFKDNISYFGIDADQLMVERSALATRLFREVMALFAEGVLRPLPYRPFAANRVVDAFRYMQQARQIGKIVITMHDVDVPVSVPLRTRLPIPPALSADATYLVTGGIGGFGLESARWLAGLGAGHLVLLGRRGLNTPGIVPAVTEIEALGSHVHVYACDVTDRAALASVLAEIRRDLPPLRGVLHAAMVLDDGLIRNLDAARFRAALAPKAQGAWNLHLQTIDLPLDFFILYSSATTFIGNPGQANYVAANLFLESLAALRRSEGLAATCVSWGAIGDVGYLTRHAAVKEGLQSRLGGDAIASAQALAVLGAMLASNQNGLAVLDFDWHSLQRFLPVAQTHRFDDIRHSAGQRSAGSEQMEDIHSLLAGRSADEMLDIVATLLTSEVAQILQIPADRIDRSRSLYDLGMDSLMGMELVLGIEKRFGVALPVMALNEGPSILRIAERLTSSLAQPSTDQGHDANLKDMVSSLAAQHAETLSTEMIDDTLNDLHQQVRQGARLIS